MKKASVAQKKSNFWKGHTTVSTKYNQLINQSCFVDTIFITPIKKSACSNLLASIYINTLGHSALFWKLKQNYDGKCKGALKELQNYIWVNLFAKQKQLLASIYKNRKYQQKSTATLQIKLRWSIAKNSAIKPYVHRKLTDIS